MQDRGLRRLKWMAGLPSLLTLAAAPAWSAVREGAPAPEFRLRKLGGGRMALRELRGKPVLVSFWMPGCPGCNREAPYLQALHRKYAGRGLRIVGIAPLNGPVADLHDFVQRHGIAYPTLVDPGETVAKRYGLGTYPRTVLIDRRGNVRFVHSRFRSGDQQLLEAQIRAVL